MTELIVVLSVYGISALWLYLVFYVHSWICPRDYQFNGSDHATKLTLVPVLNTFLAVAGMFVIGMELMGPTAEFVTDKYNTFIHFLSYPIRRNAATHKN